MNKIKEEQAQEHKLFVGGLNKKTKSQHLISFLSKYAPILSLELKRKYTGGDCLGYGTAITTEEGLRKLTQIHSLVYKKRKITLAPFLKGKNLESHLAKMNSKRIFVTKIPENFSLKNLQIIFEYFGPVETVYWRNVPGNRRPIGVVFFRNSQNAKTAMNVINYNRNEFYGIKVCYKYVNPGFLEEFPKGNGGPRQREAEKWQPRQRSYDDSSYSFYREHRDIELRGVQVPPDYFHNYHDSQQYREYEEIHPSQFQGVPPYDESFQQNSHQCEFPQEEQSELHLENEIIDLNYGYDYSRRGYWNEEEARINQEEKIRGRPSGLYHGEFDEKRPTNAAYKRHKTISGNHISRNLGFNPLNNEENISREQSPSSPGEIEFNETRFHNNYTQNQRLTSSPSSWSGNSYSLREDLRRSNTKPKIDIRYKNNRFFAVTRNKRNKRIRMKKFMKRGRDSRNNGPSLLEVLERYDDPRSDNTPTTPRVYSSSFNRDPTLNSNHTPSHKYNQFSK